MLCKSCTKDFEPRTEVRTIERYGEPTKEEEVEQPICDECASDLGLESPFEYES